MRVPSLHRVCVCVCVRAHARAHLVSQFVYSCSGKICALGFYEVLENIFSLLLVVEAFSLQKVVKILEEVIDGW